MTLFSRARLLLLLAAASWLAAGCVTPPGSEGGAVTVSKDRVTASDESEASKRARVRMELAGAYFERGQTTTALDQVKLALQAKPDMGEAYNLRGLIYASLADHALAEESFRKALELNPRDGDTMHNYGWYLCQQKRYAEASKRFDDALGVVSLRYGSRTLLAQGVCHAYAGDLPAAERSLLRAYEIDPGNPATAVNLSEVLYRLGQYDRARTYIARVNNMADVVSAQTLWLAARIEKRAGNEQALADIGRQLRARFPESRENAAFVGGRFNE
jgi:type IV pilus assembly protein PilF